MDGNRTTFDFIGKMVDSQQGGAESGAVGAQNSPIDPDLELIIEVWPTLSDASKAELITIVKAVERSP